MFANLGLQERRPMSQLELQLLRKQIQDAFMQRFSPVLVDLYANPANRPSNAHQLNAFLYLYLRSRTCVSIKECLTEDALEDSIWLYFNLSEVDLELNHLYFSTFKSTQMDFEHLKEVTL
jgi:hypothetical protein